MRIFSGMICGILLVTSCTVNDAFENKYTLTSPDKSIKIDIEIGEKINYALKVNNEIVLAPSEVGFIFQDSSLTPLNGLTDVKTLTHHDTITPVFGINNTVIEHYNAIKLSFKNGTAVSFRAYDDGIAYRLETSLDKKEVIINNEVIEYNFPEDFITFYPKTVTMNNGFEYTYPKTRLSAVDDGKSFSHTPLLVQSNKGTNLLITEADLLDYPGYFLKPNEEKALSLKAFFPHYPKEVKDAKDVSGWMVRLPTSYEEFIAKTSGKRTFPWRVIAIAKSDKELLNSELVYKLSTPSKLKDPSWIKPGQVAWDWWNGMTLTGVDFEPGINTATYKYNIDFAAEYGIPYIILDAGWANTNNMFEITEGLDLPFLLEYGKEKGVDLILWTTWFDLYDNMDEYLDTFAQWGVKGVKIDFFNRCDQIMVQKVEEITAAAAKRQLMVDLHGIYTTTGLFRTYPNMMTKEGVLGLEWNKWPTDEHEDYGKYPANPLHSVTIPFIRMATGPADYTPGAMVNSNPDTYRSDFMNPMSQGTRCHQLAMYVAFYSPLQMLSDEAPLYQAEPEVTKFITSIPVVWDKTVPLDSKISEYLTIARKKEQNWYISGLNNNEAREIAIDFTFLDEGTYDVQLFEDGNNTISTPSSYSQRTFTVDRTTKTMIDMASGGGFAMIVKPK